MRVQCPHCETSYTLDRCGVKPAPEDYGEMTIRCVVCGEDFDATLLWTPAVSAVPGITPNWFARTVLRRKVIPAVSEQVGFHTVESRPRT